jgi:WD40 repeat protein
MDGDSCAGATGGAVPQTSLPQAVCFSPDGRRLASISLDNGHTLTLWDWRSGARLAEQRTQPGAPPAVYGVVWSAFEPSRLARRSRRSRLRSRGGRQVQQLFRPGS